MRRVLPLFLLTALIAGCDPVSTAITAAVAADPVVQEQITHVRILATRDGQPKLDEIYKANTIPGSLTFVDESDGEKKSPLRVSVQGFFTNEEGKLRDRILDAQVSARISRSAQVGFVARKTKLLRMGLSEKCLGDPCKDKAGTTCIAGECVSEVVPDPGALPDAPSDPNEALVLGGFSDIDPNAKGGSGGSGGTGGAGTGGAGEGGAGAGGAGAGGAGAGGAGAGGAGGSDPCEGLPALEISSSGGAPGGLLNVGDTVEFIAPGGAELIWKLTVGGQVVEPAGSVAGDKISLKVDFCEAQLEVTDSKCSNRKSLPLNLKVTGQKGALIAASRCSADAALRCGSRLQPWCDFAGPIAALDTVKPDDSGTPDDPSDDLVALKVEAYDPGNAKTEYSGPVVLPPDVSVWGGYDPITGLPHPEPGQKRSRLRWSSGLDAKDPIPAGTTITDTIRSVLVVTSKPKSTPRISLRDLEVQMPQAPDMPPPPGPKSLFAGIHLDRNLDATLERVAVLPGDPLPETTDGLYVSGGQGDPGADGAQTEPVVKLIDCDIRPSASAGGFSNGVKIDRQTSTRLLICGGKIEGGGAQSIGDPSGPNWSAGLLLWGRADTVLDGLLAPSDGRCGSHFKFLVSDIPLITGGLANRAFGAVLDAQVPEGSTPPSPWFARNKARLVGLAGVSFEGAGFPAGLLLPSSAEGRTSGSGLYINARRPVSVTLGESGGSPEEDTASVGLDMKNATSATPLEGKFFGVWAPLDFPASPPPSGGQDSLGLVDLTIQGHYLAGVIGADKSSTPDSCFYAKGASLEAPFDGGSAKILESVAVGGNACQERVGISTLSMSLTLGANTLVYGSKNKAFNAPKTCFSAAGIGSVGYEKAPVKVSGGHIDGGDHCQGRSGIYSNGSLTLEDTDVIGSSFPEGEIVRGLVYLGSVLDTVKIARSTVVGGSATHNEGSSGELEGVLMETSGNAEISGSTIQGCKESEQCVNVNAYGVRFSPSDLAAGSSETLTISKDPISGKNTAILGGLATRSDGAASEVAGIYALSNGKIDINGATVVQGCEAGKECKGSSAYGLKLLRVMHKTSESDTLGAFTDALQPARVSESTIHAGLGSGAKTESVGVLVATRSYDFKTLETFHDPVRANGPAIVDIENNKEIAGNDAPGLPGRPDRSSGVVVSVGGVRIRGIAGDLQADPQTTRVPQKIRAGNAKNFAKGVEYCPGDELPGAPGVGDACTQGEVSDCVIEGGDAGVAVGLDVGYTRLLKVNANEARAVGGPNTNLSWGTQVQWSPGGVFSNNYFFGAQEAKLTDVGCQINNEFIDPKIDPAHFVYNACVSASSASGGRGLVIDLPDMNPFAPKGVVFSLLNNIAYAESQLASTNNHFSWLFQGGLPVSVGPALDTKGNTAPLPWSNSLAVGADTPLLPGEPLCDLKPNNLYYCSLGSPNGDRWLSAAVQGFEMELLPSGDRSLPHKGKPVLDRSAWMGLDAADCKTMTSGSTLPNLSGSKGSLVPRDFDGTARELAGMPGLFRPSAGPDYCEFDLKAEQ